MYKEHDTWANTAFLVTELINGIHKYNRIRGYVT
jgi:hypothetical protein